MKSLLNLHFQLFQSFWGYSQRCCLIPLVLLERSVTLKQFLVILWPWLVDSSLIKDLVTIVGLDGDLLYLGGRLKTQGETLRESPSGHPAGVTERYFGKFVSAESISSYSLRMFEAGKEACWPVTWEMVAPEPARSFIVSEPPVWLDKSTCRVRTHARGLDDIHVESSVRWTTDVTMYSGSMSFKINPPRCYSVDQSYIEWTFS